jgi:hypothetical protein
VGWGGNGSGDSRCPFEPDDEIILAAHEPLLWVITSDNSIGRVVAFEVFETNDGSTSMFFGLREVCDHVLFGIDGNGHDRSRCCRILDLIRVDEDLVLLGRLTKCGLESFPLALPGNLELTSRDQSAEYGVSDLVSVVRMNEVEERVVDALLVEHRASVAERMSVAIERCDTRKGQIVADRDDRFEIERARSLRVSGRLSQCDAEPLFCSNPPVSKILRSPRSALLLERTSKL